MPDGRSSDEWMALADTTRAFLGERAQMGLATSYTELNAVLVQRTRVAGFDFDLDVEWAALGELLGACVRRRPLLRQVAC